jgi:hypothetical protein
VGRRLSDLARTGRIDSDLIPINGVKTLRDDHDHPSLAPHIFLVSDCMLTSNQQVGFRVKFSVKVLIKR